MDMRYEIAQAMRKIPDHAPDIKDFFPDGIRFDNGEWEIDDVVKLYEYKHEHFWHNIAQSAMRDELIPCATYIDQIRREIGLEKKEDDEFFERLMFAGSLISEDRKYRAMSDEDREIADRISKDIKKEFADPNSELGNVLAQAMDAVNSKMDDIESLNKLLEE